MSYKDIEFKEIDLSTLDDYGRLTNPDRKYHLYNGPYFKKDTQEEHTEYINTLREKLKNNEIVESNIRLIVLDGEILGFCSWYWRSKETDWLEVGIVICNENNWSKGIGTVALIKWIDKMFEKHEQIVRIGLTTFSGNVRMMGLAEKIGLEKEACYKKARKFNGEYFDSVSYGILKEDWQKLRSKKF